MTWWGGMEGCKGGTGRKKTWRWMMESKDIEPVWMSMTSEKH